MAMTMRPVAGRRICAPAVPVLLSLIALLLVALALAASQPAFAETAHRAGDLAAAGVDAPDAKGEKGTPGEKGAPDAKDDTTAAKARRVIADGLYTFASVSKDGQSLSVRDESTSSNIRAELAETSSESWSQKWILVFDRKSGTYTVRNLASRMVLGVAGKIKAKAPVRQQKKVLSNRQRWIVHRDGKMLTLRSAANPKLAMSVAKGPKGAFVLKLKKLRLSDGTPLPTKAQTFKTSKARAIVDGRSYFITSAKSAKKAVTVKDDSRASNAKVTVGRNKELRWQKFRFLKSGKAGYVIQGAASCKYLGVKGAGIRQFASKAGKARKWSVELDLATGTFSIASAKYPKKRLDMASGKLAMRKASGKATQRFALTPTHGMKLYVDPGHGWYNSVFDPGAPGSGREEADLTRDLAERIVEQLKGTDVEAVFGGQFHVDYFRRNAKAESLGCDLVLSIHFDAGGGSTTSTMVGTRGPLSCSKAFNSIIHEKLVSSTGLRDGGTTHRGDITIVNGRVPAVLMEVAFIDNSACLSKYLNRRDLVAESLAAGVIEASRTPEVQR